MNCGLVEVPSSDHGNSPVAQSCLTLCDPMNHSTPDLPVHHQLPEFTQTHVHRVGDAIQPSHPVIPFCSWLQSFLTSFIRIHNCISYTSDQFSSVAQLCPTLCDPMNYSMLGLPVHHQLLEFTQTHVHQVGDVIQPSHPLLSPSHAFNLAQHQGLFQWVNSLHEVAKVLEFQL